MFERFKRTRGWRHGGGRAPGDARKRHHGTRRRRSDHEHMRAVRARQREEFGGVNWGAAFFGWLVAVGLGALLVGLLAAAGAAVGLTALSEAEAAGDATEIGLGGAIALLAALAVAYFAGGYVAGRMSRFDGARQGLGTWLLALAVTIVLAIVGAVLGSEYNVLERLELPAVPVGDSELATGGLLALADRGGGHADRGGRRRQGR